MERGFFITMALLCFFIVLVLLSSKKISRKLGIDESFFYAIFGFLFLIVLFFTNPSGANFRDDVKTKLMNDIKKKEPAPDPNTSEELREIYDWSMKSKEHFWDITIDLNFTLKNYKIFSILLYERYEKKEIIGVGFLGIIFTKEITESSLQ